MNLKKKSDFDIQYVNRSTCAQDKYVVALKLRKGMRVGMTAAQSLQNNIVATSTGLFYSPSAGNNTRFP